MKKITTLLLTALFLSSGLVATSCASRTPQQKKTRSFKRHHKPGDRMPCPTHDC
ncbi:hypothetical protein J0X19_06350 [Hymenobacter sp. BT186]|uniref:Lipoprotein n=1 Tax=Hymenobacter telluris TaxID=2816474 RepID=A0A939EVT5_9BACT|nr:hypothetical protein [Hymenobacter telluris]MBO0357560.1 hypothetical protein [Hymenobacter telluris]MBW3373586.1 hypothetical protein [Hymenobacter norwichensis]